MGVVGPLHYATGESGQTRFSYKAGDIACGRLELGIIYKDANGHDEMLTWRVVNSGVDCAALPVPNPPPSDPNPPPPNPPPPESAAADAAAAAESATAESATADSATADSATAGSATAGSAAAAGDAPRVAAERVRGSVDLRGSESLRVARQR